MGWTGVTSVRLAGFRRRSNERDGAPGGFGAAVGSEWSAAGCAEDGRVGDAAPTKMGRVTKPFELGPTPMP